jgi:hypothetical protein
MTLRSANHGPACPLPLHAVDLAAASHVIVIISKAPPATVPVLRAPPRPRQPAASRPAGRRPRPQAAQEGQPRPWSLSATAASISVTATANEPRLLQVAAVPCAPRKCWC